MKHFLHIEMVGEISEELNDKLRETRMLVDPGEITYIVGEQEVKFKFKKAVVSDVE